MRRPFRRVLASLMLPLLCSLLLPGLSARATDPVPEEDLDALSRGAEMGRYDLSAMPERYKLPATERGRIISLTYDNAWEETLCYVYLPYGYHPDERYDIVYLMHGGGGNPGSFLNDARQNQIFANMVDHLIEEGTIRPLILVAPTFYRFGHTGRSLQDSWDDLNAFSQGEFLDDLVPFVEGRFSTYAETTDEAGLSASRTHRAFSGFSLGAVTTWEIFINHMNIVAIYLPVSGDSWHLGRGAGAQRPGETAQLLADTVTNAGFTAEDVLVYGFTGTKDGMEYQMSSQINAMRGIGDIFGDNLIYRVREDAQHLLVDMDEHLFYMFQDVFPAPPKMHP